MKTTAPPDVPPVVPPAGSLADVPRPAAMPRQSISAGGILRAIFLKEARELAPALGVFAAVVSVLLVLIFYVTSDRVIHQRGGQPTALPYEYVVLSVFAPSIAGFLAALIQFFPELRPARLGLLFHRPAPHTLLFVGKVFTGISLTLFAIGVPLFAGLLWLSSPHNMPLPFTWSMALIPLSDLLAAIPCYAAGALIALRTDARWYGSRVLPAATAIVAVTISVAVPTFGWALLDISIATAVLGAATLAAFHPGQSYRRRPLKGRFAVGLMLAPSIAIVCIACVGGLAILYETANRDPRRVNQKYYDRRMLADGTPVIRMYDNSTAKTVLLDPAGKPLPETEQPAPSNDGSASLHPLINYDRSRTFHDPNSYFWAVTSVGDTTWYEPSSRDYLVKFNQQRRQLAGSMGARGFSPETAVPPERFPHALAELHFPGGCISMGDRVFEFADNNELKPVYTTPNHEDILLGTPLSSDYGVGDAERFAVLFTKSAIWFVRRNADPREDFRTVAHYDAPDLKTWQTSVDFLQRTQEFVVHHDAYPSDVSSPVTVAYIKADGSATRVVHLPGFTPPEQPHYSRFSPFESYVGPAMLPPGLGLLGLAFAAVRDPGSVPLYVALKFSQGLRMEETICLVSAALASIVTFFLARRHAYSLRAAVGWSVALFLMGACGILLLLVTRGLPRMVKCPGCGKRRPLGEAHCPHCGADFPRPAHAATEIFVSPQ